MAEPMMSLAFGGCTADEIARAEARQLLHDQLIADHPVRLGPVRWRHYEPTHAEEALRVAELLDDPVAQGLLRWLRETPDSELVIAFVPTPGHDA